MKTVKFGNIDVPRKHFSVYRIGQDGTCILTYRNKEFIQYGLLYYKTKDGRTVITDTGKATETTIVLDIPRPDMTRYREMFLIGREKNTIPLEECLIYQFGEADVNFVVYNAKLEEEGMGYVRYRDMGLAEHIRCLAYLIGEKFSMEIPNSIRRLNLTMEEEGEENIWDVRAISTESKRYLE